MFTLIMFFWAAFILSTIVIYAVFSNRTYFGGFPLTLKTVEINSVHDILTIAVKWYIHAALMTIFLFMFHKFLSNTFVDLKQISFDYLFFWGWAIMFNFEVWIQIVEHIFTKTKSVDFDSYSGVV